MANVVKFLSESSSSTRCPRTYEGQALASVAWPWRIWSVLLDLPKLATSNQRSALCNFDHACRTVCKSGSGTESSRYTNPGTCVTDEIGYHDPNLAWAYSTALTMSGL